MALSAHATAQAENDVVASLDSSGCSPDAVEEVRHLMRVELKNLEPGARREAVSIFVECALEQVKIRMSDSGGELSRTIDLSRVTPSVRARVIALAIAELIRASPEREVIPEKPLEKPPPEPPSPPAPTVEEPSRRRVLALVQAVNFGLAPAALWGGAIGFDYATDHVALGIGSSVVTNERHFELGDVRVLMTDLSAYAAWLIEGGSVSAEFGLGGSFGVARIEGTSDEGQASGGSVAGAWSGPFLLGALSYSLTDSFVLELRARVGFVMLPVIGRVARGADIEIDGIWSNLQLGCGLDL